MQSSISSTKTARANVRFYSIGIGMKDSDNFAKYVLAPNKAVLGNSGQEGQLKLAVSGKNYQEYVDSIIRNQLANKRLGETLSITSEEIAELGI